VRRGDFPVGHPDFGKIQPCATCDVQRSFSWLTQHCGLSVGERTIRYECWQAGGWEQMPPETRRLYREQRKLAGEALQAALTGWAGLYTFFGDFGAGKTLALQIVANEARLEMIESLYAPFSLILEHLRSLYSQEEASSQFWQRLLEIPVLCLDEVTRFNETAWAREKLFTLADTRYRRRDARLTLFATNDDPRQMLPPSEDVGYLYSRMRQGQLLELGGDMREVVKSTPR
jgi:DNA replication protein DnaC